MDPLLAPDGSAAPGGSSHGGDVDDVDERRSSQIGAGAGRASFRASLFANAEGGRLTLQEVRYRLSEARNIRLRKTNERNSNVVMSPITRNTTGGNAGGVGVGVGGMETIVELSSFKKSESDK